MAIHTTKLCSISLIKVVKITPRMKIIAIALSLSMLAFTSPATSLLSELKKFRYMNDVVQFDRDDYWQTPEEFAKRKVGDCEDYAVYAKSLLDKAGYKSFIFSVFTSNGSHAVLVYKDGLDNYYLDLDYPKKIKVKTLSDLADDIRPDWAYCGIMRQDGNAGVISRRFNSKHQASVSINSLWSE